MIHQGVRICCRTARPASWAGLAQGRWREPGHFPAQGLRASVHQRRAPGTGANPWISPSICISEGERKGQILHVVSIH